MLEAASFLYDMVFLFRTLPFFSHSLILNLGSPGLIFRLMFLTYVALRDLGGGGTCV
jgi:hypothetical protein